MGLNAIGKSLSKIIKSINCKCKCRNFCDSECISSPKRPRNSVSLPSLRSITREDAHMYKIEQGPSNV